MKPPKIMFREIFYVLTFYLSLKYIRLNFDKKCRPFSFLIALYLPVYLILYLYFLSPIPQLQYVHIPSPLVSTYTLPIGGLIKW